MCQRGGAFTKGKLFWLILRWNVCLHKWLWRREGTRTTKVAEDTSKIANSFPSFTTHAPIFLDGSLSFSPIKKLENCPHIPCCCSVFPFLSTWHTVYEARYILLSKEEKSGEKMAGSKNNAEIYVKIHVFTLDRIAKFIFFAYNR